MPLQTWNDAERHYIFRDNAIVWEGPSKLDHGPIFVIATGTTANRKIGRMIQLWILTQMDPIKAVQTGRDTSICGDCVHRGRAGKQRSCYVDWWRSPENIHQYKHLARRMTPTAFAKAHPNEQLRIGAYGDPAAVPLPVWRDLLTTAAGWTAYTHQWRTAHPGYRDFCMASVDTEDEQREAVAMGWRTFRAHLPNAPVLSDEITCPASEEAGHKVQCAACNLCRGGARQAKNIAIAAHGTGAKWFGMRPLLL